ncbi:transposase [Pseudonocardia sp. H11422]|uniref:transposase n=1 Tax=Pseudonocardia sp. H11422 TaxID=2835866 RepID=UPI0027E2C7D8|nr:transposase [Pseudonocardia sp. H11422]
MLVKRVWQCRHQLCPKRTWTERHEAIPPRAALTARAAAASVDAVRTGATVARQARGFGVSWHTIMRQVRALGRPQVDDPARLDEVTAIGVDEHAWQRARAGRPAQYATGIVDLTPGRPARLLDLVPGRTGAALRTWLAARPATWKAQITTAALDPFRGYATAGRPDAHRDPGARPVPRLQARSRRARRGPPRPARHPGSARPPR